MKNITTTLLLLCALFAGLSLLLYPTVSDYWNSFRQSKAIASYVDEVASMDEDKYQELWEAARAYNESLTERTNVFLLSDEQQAAYESLLNISGTGIMGYVEIPSISCTLPVYHGTESSVLQIAIGHLEWSSLPVGGEGTHTVLSGHRGLPSAKLFTDLDKVVVGDIFVLRILDDILTYEVDRIAIVEPDDTDALMIEPGKDYCTLFTCTPYGINTHRLLVRGHRIENIAQARLARVTADAVQIDPMIVAPVVLIPILFLFMVFLLLEDFIRKKEKGGGSHDI